MAFVMPRRHLAAAVTLAGLAVFVAGPALLPLDRAATVLWFAAAWIVAATVTAVAAWRTALLARSAERVAWLAFAAGCGLWTVATVYWAAATLRDQVPAFPSFADAPYLATSLLLIVGTYCFVSGRGINRLQLANLLLTLLAVAVGGLFLLEQPIAASGLDLAGRLVAIAYPTISVGTATFALMCLALYLPRRERPTGLLILAAIAGQSVPNFFYGLQLLAQHYQVGAFFDYYWVLGFAFLTLAARRRRADLPLGAEAQERGLPAPWKRRAEALVPAAAVVTLTIAHMIGHGSAEGPVSLLALGGLLGLALALGAREYLTMEAERRLTATAERNAREAAEDRAKLETVLAHTMDCVIVLDRDWRVAYLNPRVAATAERLAVGGHFWTLLPEIAGTLFEEAYRRAMAEQVPVDFTAHLPMKDQWLEVHAFPAPDRLSIFYRDVSAEKRARERLEHLARRDHLTGLDNRMSFREQLDRAIAGATEARPTAVFYLDLDEFKEINDGYGHPYGDAILEMTAKRLRAVAGADAALARVGGDEFAVVAPVIGTRADAAATADRIMAALAAPYRVDGTTLRIGASMGIVFCPQDCTDADGLFQRADIALYAAKADGRGVYRFFEPEMAARMGERQALKADLAQALERGELALAFQPIVHLGAGRACGVEALLRWRHPQRGLQAPGSFIALAEETGLIVPIGQWAIHEACRAARALPEHLVVSVNLSPTQFASCGLPLRVAAALADSGLPPNRLELEITESVLLKDTEANLDILHQLRRIGVRIALDDFGTGYSSLAYLSRFPFDRIKIDRSFVGQMAERHEARSIVRAVAGLARSLGIAVTAEGVETDAQLALLAEAGCEQAQGYLFSRPVAAEALPAVLAALDRGGRARRLAG